MKQQGLFMIGAPMRSRTRNRPLRRVPALTALALVLAPGAALAEAWLLEPYLSVGLGYDDNVELVTDDSVGSPVGMVSVGADLRRVTETLEVRGRGQLDYRGYTDEDAPDNEDAQLLALELLHRRPTGDWGLDGRFRRDTTTAEFDRVALGDDTGSDVDAGVVEEDVRRHRLRVAPSWRRQLTERVGLEAAYSFQDLNYSDSGANNLEDSRVHQLAAQGDYALSERTTVGARLETLLFRPDDSADVDAYIVSGVIEHRVSVRTTVGASLGISHAEDKDLNDSETDLIGRLSLRHRAERWRGVLQLERQLLPSAIGRLEEVNQFLVGVEQDVSPRTRLGLNLRAFDAERLGDARGGASREYLRISPTWSWRLDRNWEIAARYEYRQVERDNGNDSADRNAVMFTLRYRPLRELP
ncbi:hypothetical protein [Alkalilimnicola sp. S0819]|uniref:hypothetical protein n=1 Tax=Alkalilimnicola sp. S0819 TaxID=2613922 RepID=UPI00126284ED|nr:hypothetical protein [Alkalilimnicola sp. S0819]KAB7627895.1 hypothetical protein F3N43_02660 [Alkalilimnicola sp. S0819]MPQ15531.1 hypothetical protein [Alkalilimnicola sp. S0819]